MLRAMQPRRTGPVLIASLLFSSPAFAVEISPGASYAGPVTLEVPGLDIQFRLPAGFTGRATEEGMLIGHKTRPGLILGTVRSQASVSAIKAELAGPIPLDEGAVLRLKGQVRAKGNRLTANYVGAGLAGYAVARRSAAGRAIGFIAATKPKNLSGMKRGVEAMARSVRFVKSKQSAYWRDFIRNKMWVYMNTGGGASTRTRITLCSNGRFSYYGGTSVFSQTRGITSDTTISGTSRGGHEGSWKVYGSPRQGRLILKVDGAQETTQLTLRREKTRLFINGVRYLNDTRAKGDC